MAEFRDAGATVVAVSTDPPERGREVVEALGLEFPVLADPSGAAVAAFGVAHPEGNPIDGGTIARPATFLLDRDGRVVWRDLTENWRVRPRPDEILQRLASIP